MSDPSQKLYEKVASQILTQIQQGVLPLDKKIPSIRVFSRQLGVSLSTVIHAYQILESRNVLQSRPQSGYYVNAQAPLSDREPQKPQPPPNFSKIPIKKIDEGELPYVISAFADPENLNLSWGFPSHEIFPLAALKKALSAGFEKQGSGGASL